MAEATAFDVNVMVSPVQTEAEFGEVVKEATKEGTTVYRTIFDTKGAVVSSQVVPRNSVVANLLNSVVN